MATVLPIYVGESQWQSLVSEFEHWNSHGSFANADFYTFLFDAPVHVYAMVSLYMSHFHACIVVCLCVATP